MPTVDLVDETYLRAPIAPVAALIHDQRRWAEWWPRLLPTVFMDRGDDGIRWNIAGALVGSMEIWLEALAEPLGGVVLHFYLRADPTVPGSATTAAPAIGAAAYAQSRRWALQSKRNFWALKDELETDIRGRGPGDRADRSALR